MPGLKKKRLRFFLTGWWFAVSMFSGSLWSPQAEPESVVFKNLLREESFLLLG
jgi:hypothetical protein